MELSRRDFIRMGGSACLIAGAGAALTGCGSSASASGAASEDTAIGTAAVNFTKETEILIVGTGVAALAAAMEPAKAGKQITFVDKQATWGGDSKISCFFGFANGSKPQLDAGNTTTIDAYWEAAAEKLTAGVDYSWYADWVKGKTYANTAFVDTAIADFGATYQEAPTEAELPRLFSSVVLPGEGIGTGYENILAPIHDTLESMGAEFVFEQRAIALIKDTAGTVIGCRFRDENTGEYLDIKAKAVVLATGGFINNQEMVVKYAESFAPYGALVNHNMGEGHMIAAAAGAQFFQIDTATDTYCTLMGDIPNCTTWGYYTPIVLVLPNGKRFIEEAQSHDAALSAVEAGYREWWSIFDQKAFDSRCIAKSVENNIKAHADAYVTANTIEELAVAMGINAADLSATFASYDEQVANGVDVDFGKKAWLNSLQAPFHALRLNVVRYKSAGGLIVNDKNIVIDADGNGIPGLYACGALTTLAYASVSTCAATGYYVGQSLATDIA